MRILLVTSFFPPTHIGGTEQRTHGYALKLIERGHNVQVVCAGHWEKGEKYWNGFSDETYCNIPVRRINFNWKLAPDPNGYLYCNPIVEREVGKWMADWTPDIVHVTSCLTLSASPIQAAHSQNLPVVLSLTDYWFICPRLNLLRYDDTLCDGITTNWECLNCKAWDSNTFRGLRAILSEKPTELVMTRISKYPFINRVRGLRGFAVDMEDRRAYLNLMLDQVDCLTAPSNHLSEVFNECGISNPIKVIHSGHNLSWLEDKSRIKKQSDNGVSFGYIGQIIPIKGVHILIAAFAAASVSGKAKLLIYGDQNKDQSYRTQLRSIFEGMRDSVNLQGPFPHERLGEVLTTIDVLVVPSHWHENNPRVIQEAFAAKTPVIASNVGGINEFVSHEVNGLLFERGNIDDLARQIRRIIEEPGLLENLRAGVLPVKTIDEEVVELEVIYEELISEKAESFNHG